MQPSRATESSARDRSHETTAAGVSWLAFARCRDPFRLRWPSVFRIPLANDHYQLATSRKLTVRSILDVGATDRLHEPLARAAWPDVDYRSLDIDRSNRHDYHDFQEVDRSFDLVTCLEVLEHVAPKLALELMSNCFKACRSGGYVLASVPNVFTPGIQHEWTHIASLHYMDLAGLVAWCGFEVIDAARVYQARRVQRLLHARVLHQLHRLLNVDYAQSIVVLGKKP